MNDSIATQQPLQPDVINTKSFSISNMFTGMDGSPNYFSIVIFVILFAMLIMALYIFFERYFAIKRSTDDSSELISNVRDYVYNNKIESALEYCKRTSSPEARLVYKGLQRLGRPIKEISDAIENSAQLEVYRLEKNLNVLATISGAAPMLGFLGTVVGMIQAFQNLAAQPTNADKTQLLSEGIYTAMGTTAFGLVVGLVAYIGYNFLVSKVEKSVHSIQTSVTDFLDLLNKPL